MWLLGPVHGATNRAGGILGIEIGWGNLGAILGEGAYGGANRTNGRVFGPGRSGRQVGVEKRLRICSGITIFSFL